MGRYVFWIFLFCSGFVWGQNVPEIQADRNKTETVKLSELGAKVGVLPLKDYGENYVYKRVQISSSYVWLCGVTEETPFAYEIFQLDKQGNLIRKFPVPGYNDFIIDPEQEELFIARGNGLYRYSREGRLVDSMLLNEKSQFSSLFWFRDRIYYRILQGAVDIRVLSGELSWLSEEVETPVYRLESCNRLLKDRKEYASDKTPVPAYWPVFSSDGEHLYVGLPEKQEIQELKGNRLLPYRKIRILNDVSEGFSAYAASVHRFIVGDYLFYGYGSPRKAFYIIHHLKNHRQYHCVYLPGERGIEDDIYHTGFIAFKSACQTGMFYFISPRNCVPEVLKGTEAIQGLF